MKIEYRKGDLFETDINIIVHGCNDMGVAGAGIILKIKELYPEAIEAYHKHHRLNGKLEGGEIINCRTNGKIIVNMITQHLVGRNGRRFAQYDWIAEGFYNLNSIIRDSKFEIIQKIAMPAIGSGLGGADFNVIAAIIESECKDVQPVMYLI